MYILRLNCILFNCISKKHLKEKVSEHYFFDQSVRAGQTVFVG